MLLVTFAVKWALIGRLVPGNYPVWGWYHLRWWVVHQMSCASEVALRHIAGTDIFPWYLSLMGCEIGSDVQVKTVYISDYDLISIGDGSVIDDVSSSTIATPCESIPAIRLALLSNLRLNRLLKAFPLRKFSMFYRLLNVFLVLLSPTGRSDQRALH